MIRQFVPYRIALTLKRLGFDERCFGYYNEVGGLFAFTNLKVFWNSNKDVHYNRSIRNFFNRKKAIETMCVAPTWQQVTDWLREKYNIDVIISSNVLGYGFILYHRYPPKNTTDSRVFQHYSEAREQAVLKALTFTENETERT